MRLPDPCRAALALALLIAPGAGAFELAEGRVQLHGFYRGTLGVIGDGFERRSDWYVSQLSHTLDLEGEFELAPDGWGPFSLIEAYTRIEVRYECVWHSGCGIVRSAKIFGNGVSHAPAKTLTDGRLSTRAGDSVFRPGGRAHLGSTRLFHFTEAPPLDALAELGAAGIEDTFRPIRHDALVSERQIDGGFDETAFILGPMNTLSRVDPIAAIVRSPNRTSPLPLRPRVPEIFRDVRLPQRMWVPTFSLRERIDDLDDHDQNLTEHELRLNHGASQDEYELKEAYLDLELFDGRLFLRLGKQTVVWGKTELFRSQDQFNPQDLALSSLPSLEESRTALWSARAIYSLYDVGPFEDVRLELAAILDDFEPADLGRCGEPYTVFLVCQLSFALFAHGFSGVGVAGFDKPPHPWNSWKGLEIGGRLEFRWGRLSLALTDFYGYGDFPTANVFTEYERKVDPRTGRPLDALGRPLDPGDPEQALLFHPANRQLFDLFCSATVGLAAGLLPELAEECLVAIFNNTTPLAVPLPFSFEVTIAGAISLALSGTPFSSLVIGAILNPDDPLAGPTAPLVVLNQDANDGGFTPGILCSGFGPPSSCLASFLTDQQEALVGCGPFYGTNCDVDGIDLFNTEASVLLQAFPQFPRGAPVATRYADGKLFILPGARGPGDAGYDPGVDGCVDPGVSGCAGAARLVDPRTGRFFRSEMAALSFNMLGLLAAIGEVSPETAGGPGCSVNQPERCRIVRALLQISGVRHYDVRAGGNGRFGRRDFVWNGGGPIQLQFNKRNVLGLALDFAEDWSKTNWGIEMAWVENEALAVRTKRNGFRKADVYNLTLSVDRPTFVNFLNANRTLFMNAQVFLRYIPEYERQGTFTGTDGPLSVLATFTVATGYFQDRMLVAATFVHDFGSASGGMIWNLGYRFTENFSAAVGVNVFYGGPEQNELALHPAAIRNDGGSMKSRTRFLGLTSIADRDEIQLSLRYTF